MLKGCAVGKSVSRSVLGGAAADGPPRDALALAEELASQAPSLGELERQAVLDRLASAGLVPAAATQAPDHATAIVKTALKIPSGEHVDPARTSQLLALLIEFIQIVDNVTWNLWTLKTSQSPVRRRSEIVPSMAAFCRGGGAPQREKTERDVRKLMALNSAILVSLPRLAPPLFRKAFGNLLPDQIKVENPAPPTSLLRGKETGWWRAYEAQAVALNEDSFEKLFFNEVAEKAAEIIPPEHLSGGGGQSAG